MPDQPFTNPALPILTSAQGIDDADRSDLHDIFHSTKDERELAQRLQPLAVPDEVKQQLYDAKKKAHPSAGDAVEKGLAVIDRLGEMDPQKLALAERYPKLVSTLISVAAKDAEKGTETAGAAQDTSKAASKGKEASSEAAKPAAALPPRADGLEHLPPIPEKHHRIVTSDGDVHDIPAENLQKALQIDSNTHVMNP